MLPVLGIRTPFRVITASDGNWVAVGGFKKRHLQLIGAPGTSAESLELLSVTLP